MASLNYNEARKGSSILNLKWFKVLNLIFIIALVVISILRF